MYARVWSANAEPEKRDEIIQFLRDTVLPSVHQQPGYKGYLALFDPSTGKFIAISLREAEADLEASEASAQENAAKARPLFASTPVREVYEVLVQE